MIFSEQSNEMGIPTSGWLQTQAVARLPTPKHRITTDEELSPFSLLFPLASSAVLRTISGLWYYTQ